MSLRALFLLCVYCCVWCLGMATWAIWRHAWEPFALWTMLVVGLGAHGVHVLHTYMAEQRRETAREHAGEQLRAMMAAAHGEREHQRQERAERLRGMRS